MDDLSYYPWIESFFIRQYGLWRLQGIFEGILRKEFFPSQELTGLKRKLDKVRQLGFTLSDDDYNEILDWGRLRNALSHFPPGKYRPNSLNENDISDYKILIEKVIQNLKLEKAKRNL